MVNLFFAILGNVLKNSDAVRIRVEIASRCYIKPSLTLIVCSKCFQVNNKISLLAHLFARNKTKNQKFLTVFSLHCFYFINFFKCRSDQNWMSVELMYHSTHSHESLLYLISRGKQKEKTKTNPNTKLHPHFKWSKQKNVCFMKKLPKNLHTIKWWCQNNGINTF